MNYAIDDLGNGTVVYEIEGNTYVETNETTNLVKIDVPSYGIMIAELYPEIAPITVENFKKLVNEKFYDHMIFHRVIKDFMIQTGDPTGTGTGGSAVTIKGEFSENGVANDLLHTRGVLSMARQGAIVDTEETMNSASSQFFIVHQDSTFLDGNYAAFGHVTSGIEVVDKIATDAKPIDNNGTIPKDKQPIIEYIKVK
jgi:peptidyl-prolyl cis-trans isomerase B (cyclophilin B)